MGNCVYAWSGKGGVRGWRVEKVGRSKLSDALGKSPFPKMQSVTVMSWPLTEKVCLMCCIQCALNGVSQLTGVGAGAECRIGFCQEVPKCSSQ